MTIRVGESGKPIRYWCKIDMRSYTLLTLTFTKPDGSTFQRTSGGTPPVSLGQITVNDHDLGRINRYEYMEYTCQATDFDQPGTWTLQGKYTDTSVEPDDIFIGPATEFEVLE